HTAITDIDTLSLHDALPIYEISGIAPAVAIRQKNSTRNPRSTVATSTEIYDYLRLLFARCGQTFCIKCGAEVRKDSPDEIATPVDRKSTRLNSSHEWISYAV